MQRQNRKIVLLVDNAPSHVYDEEALSNVHVEFLNPNMTSHIQPLDSGIIHSFKAQYRKEYIFCVLDNDAIGAEDIYEITQLQGMRLVIKAWESITQQTVQNCWRHSGILHSTAPSLTQIKAETKGVDSELQAALNQLVDEQHITQKNIATTHDLLENEEEKVTENEWTIEDFIEQQQLDEREAAGEHLAELDPEPEPEPLMTWKQAGTALSKLAHLFETENGAIPGAARDLLPRLQRYVQQKVESSKKQASITAFTVTIPKK